MAQITNIAEEIKSRADIVDIIGRSVSLRKKGSLWEACCPFHNEKTPSFKVYETSQHYHCYGCGESGDVISFYMKVNNLSFMEAAEKLAEELHIDWTPGSGDSEKTRSELYAINKEAGIYFHKRLREEGNPAYEYLTNRGIDSTAMTLFGLGYAAKNGNGLYEHLTDKNMDPEKACEIGLLRKEGNTYRDKMYHRVIFPIINTRGKIVGFGGRRLDEEMQPKYINSPESKIYLKRNNLYAINSAKNAIAKEGFAILVEGYADPVVLYGYGFRNVVASLGTALTPAQAKLLGRYTKKVILAYDSDDAGKDASVKAIDILKAENFDVRVLNLPEYKDPDEYIRARGISAFTEELGRALPATEFKLERIADRHDLSQKEGSVHFLREASAVLRAAGPIEAEYYLPGLEEKTGISAGAIRMEAFGGDAASVSVSHASGNAAGFEAKPIDAPQIGVISGNSANAEKLYAIQRYLLRLFIHDTDLIMYIKGRERVFTDDAMMRIFSCIDSMRTDTKSDESISAVDQERLSEALADADRAVLSDIMMNVLISDDHISQFNDCITSLDLLELKEQEQDILSEMPVIASDDEEKTRLQDELYKVQRAIREMEER